jgi:hypothetical protein
MFPKAMGAMGWLETPLVTYLVWGTLLLVIAIAGFRLGSPRMRVVFMARRCNLYLGAHLDIRLASWSAGKYCLAGHGWDAATGGIPTIGHPHKRDWVVRSGQSGGNRSALPQGPNLRQSLAPV